MDGAEKALTEIAEPLARLFERSTGVGIDPALAAAIIAMSLVLVGAFTSLSAGVLMRRLWLRRRAHAKVTTAAGAKAAAPGLPDKVGRPLPAIAAPVAISLNDNGPVSGGVPARPAPPRPRPAPRAKPRRPTARLLAARRVRDAVMARRGEPEWRSAADGVALRTMECRSIDGVPIRVELLVPPDAQASLHLLNVWCDGAKVFNYEWLPGVDKAEKLRFLKGGDWADDIVAWRFAPAAAQAPKLRGAGGG
ncbi:MAG: hypothetical protein F9K44_01495 [Hyphomicrobiaceae bacterium]|nr:MAG: hypothetical protein F9K44_01495 [Hyphomicrobiaceae bacterium]